MPQTKVQVREKITPELEQKDFFKPFVSESVSEEKPYQKRKFSRTQFLRGKFRVAGHYVHIEYIWLAMVEWALSFVAFSVMSSGLSVETSGLEFALEGIIFSSLIVISLAAMGLYDTRQRNSMFDVLLHVLASLILCIIFMVLLKVWLTDGRWPFSRILLGVSSLAAAFIGIRYFFDKYIDGRLLRRNVLVLGTGERAHKIERLRRKTDQRGFNLVGFVPSMSCQSYYVDPDKLLKVNNICEYCLAHDIDEVVIALDDRRHGNPSNDLLDCRMSGIRVIEDLDFFEREAAMVQLDLIHSGWLIKSHGFTNNYLSYFLKRTVDIVGAIILAVVFLPVMLITAIAIKMECGLKSSVLYTQKRVGRAGRLFTIYKFRSMREDAEADGKAQWACKNDSRVTRVGEFIRKYRIDEVPQVWNVLIGNMSLVGPRPERKEFVDSLATLNDLYLERHRVAPGLTGWAQLHYPYGASDKDAIEKLKYDLYYIKNHGLFLDLYILIQTVEVVIFKKGSR
ncbi:TIGR03013 family PEP-CTERM/XrtA system glycosyltransferase [Aestuariicella hydrocarbonica]|uniref:TIGR03013 family PEP-CTERM/XrtA system glycosyltransferase n=1 Tax=Pseudomaricurvus hydrocarbonicus TaxID=1470433 RepID=A0A9E5JSP1_9GAMM|nr:TIGR03013 family XrtA/PEP-CTERM system glycosyltransferase [Aestuariicella hydrocarbonica]NHO64711.1 TIGR03013 family PEP-CTERM/XrtA system glycosyltransferase [Aestuariicella hydrocarbonica]